MTRVLLVGGDAQRHLYYFNRIAAHPGVEIVGVLLEQRGVAVPAVPANANRHDADIWRHHFEERARCDDEHFGAQDLPLTKHGYSRKTLNDADSMAFLDELDARADLTLVFGCGMIRDPLFSSLPGPVINMHLGLSPRYRGAATLFWPHYFLEPNWAGVTFHQIVAEPDAGPILHQSRPALGWDDGVHDVACRAIVQATDDMLALLERWPDWTYKRQRNTGKCFLARDFQPAHLRAVYELWDDRIAAAYLDGTITPGDPVLYRDNLRVSGKDK